MCLQKKIIKKKSLVSTGVFARDVYRLLSAARLEPTQWQRDRARLSADGARDARSLLLAQRPVRSALAINNRSALVFFARFPGLVFALFSPGDPEILTSLPKKQPTEDLPLHP